MGGCSPRKISRFLTPESTFGNNRHLFHQGIGSLEICIFSIPSLISSLAISSMARSAPLAAGVGENFEVFACYLLPESTFGNKGQLLEISKYAFVIYYQLPGYRFPWWHGLGAQPLENFDVFARYFIKLLKRPAAGDFF